ncbi:hypothetical protein CPB86DRAFT_819687 [Serendipita vermifera]|nr:hypothetical protein CPB86DRAFT_819687 [Serendipita vermifera]
MPHSLLRALKYRSTPTLPSPSQQRQQQRQYQQEKPPNPTPPTPSIFISFPDDEGGGHWCVYAGSSYITTRAILSSLYPSQQVLANAASHQDQEDGPEEPPLPDFAALEDTIQKLRRAGETPTFKRPTRPDEVVLPKKKAAFGKGISSQQYQSQRENGIEDWNAVSRRWAQQQARQDSASNTGRQDGDEDLYGGSPIANHSMSDLDRANSNSQSGRSSPAKFIRGITKTKVKDASKKAPRALVLQATPSAASSSSSRHYGDGTDYSTRPASASPTSPEYVAEGQWMASQPSATSSDRNIRKSLKRRSSLGWLFSSNRNRRASLPIGVGAGEETPVMAIVQQYNVPETVEERSAESHESALNKPLPPLPRTSEETIRPSSGSGEVETQEPSPIARPESAMSNQPERTGTPEQFTTTIQVEKGAPVGGAKLKKKFSLKRLREKFMSPSTTNIPPVPPLPTVVNVNTVSSIDSNPTEMVTSLDEAEPIELVTEMPTSLSASTMDTMVTALTDPSALNDEDMDRCTASEDSGSGSSATDSSNVAESAASTPYSTPPDTPNSAEGEKVFQVQQDLSVVVVEQIKALVAKEEVISAPVEVLEKDAGLKRSHGMRMNLDAVPTVSC